MKKLIILVEDDDSILLVVKRMLEIEGYLVMVTQSTDEALEKLDLVRPLFKQIGNPIAVITDIHMPGDGKILIEALNKDTDFKEIPIIPMTASEEKMIHGKRVLQKPFNLEALVKILNKLK